MGTSGMCVFDIPDDVVFLVICYQMVYLRVPRFGG